MPRSSPGQPTVSFILATYNRGSVVVECLRRTLACGLPARQFEIVVIDNASTDDTPEGVETLAREHANIRLIRLAANGGPVAKNMGLYENPADIQIILDDDAYPMPGSVVQALRHFQDDPRLGAAVFDVMLPDGAREASAYPDVFIGAGTAFRRAALCEAAHGAAARRPGRGLLPADFFMQAEEYDLSFRLLEEGWSVQRFWDMPLMHLKSPGARIGDRTTRLDIRNNLWLLARYLPEPLSTQLAADWLARYFHMAVRRDASTAPRDETANRHKKAFLQGAAEGLRNWPAQRRIGQLLSESTLERIFKFALIRERLAILKEGKGLRRIALGDWGKNILAYWQAAVDLDLEVTAVLGGDLAIPQDAAGAGRPLAYRGIPIVEDRAFPRTAGAQADAVVITAMSPVHAERRRAALGRSLPALPIVNLFSKSEGRDFAPVR